MSEATLTDLVAMFNRTLHDIEAANASFTYVTAIRPDQESIQHRNDYLHQIMHNRSHQQEY